MAYGTNKSFGLKPVRYMSGAPYTGALSVYPIANAYATSIYTGDPVVVLSDGTIGIGVAGSSIRGVFMGVKYTDANGNPVFSKYWPASTSTQSGSVTQALVIDDPNILFTIQEDNGAGAAGTALALADRGQNANFAVQAGSTATGLSGTTLDNTSHNTTSTLNLKIIDLDPNVGNAVGSFANWLVTINVTDLKSVGTAGV